MNRSSPTEWSERSTTDLSSLGLNPIADMLYKVMKWGRDHKSFPWHAYVYYNSLIPQAGDLLKDTLFDVRPIVRTRCLMSNSGLLKINEIS